jgi:pSer/pThr/pTyr-binding forkhead associated (FHA) protein
VLVTVDDDLAVGEFGIATRLVAPAEEASPAPAAPPPPSLPLDQPAQTMIYKAAAPVVPDAPPPETQREVITLTVAGRTHEVTSPSVVLGRSREADVRVADVNVSRRHAELRQEGASYWIVDLGSTNGVEVNGKHVDRARLRDGDRITIGATEVVFGRALPS